MQFWYKARGPQTQLFFDSGIAFLVLPTAMVLSQAQVEALEDELFTYRQRQFKLAARVHLSHLTFEDGFRERMNDHQNVRRLERIMEIQGCQRLMKDCHVPVLVPAADWGRRVRQRPGDDLIPSLDVDFDYRLRAQDHENLIAAARKILGPTSQWWIVDVYLTEQGGAFIWSLHMI